MDIEWTGVRRDGFAMYGALFLLRTAAPNDRVFRQLAAGAWVFVAAVAALYCACRVAALLCAGGLNLWPHVWGATAFWLAVWWWLGV